MATFTGLTEKDFEPDSPVAQRYVSDLTAATSLTTGIPEGEQLGGTVAVLSAHFVLSLRDADCCLLTPCAHAPSACLQRRHVFGGGWSGTAEGPLWGRELVWDVPPGS